MVSGSPEHGQPTEPAAGGPAAGDSAEPRPERSEQASAELLPALRHGDRLPETVAALAAGAVGAQRRALLGRLMLTLANTARAAGATGVGSGRWLAEAAIEIAPHVPIRDLETLQEHYGPLRADALADALVRNASRVSAGIGMAAGAVSAVEWSAPPALVAAPIQLAAETLAVLAVEVKLIAELQEVYGQPVQGSPAQRAAAYLNAWAHGRGVDLKKVGLQFAQSGLTSAIAHATKRELREALLRRLGRNVSALVPFFAGAAIAAELNRRATRSLAESVRRDLIRQAARGAR